MAARLMARPVDQLVTECGIIGFRRRAGVGADESFARRKLNAVGRGAIKGPAATMMNSRAGRGDESLGLLDRRDDRWMRGPEPESQLLCSIQLSASASDLKSQICKGVPAGQVTRTYQAE